MQRPVYVPQSLFIEGSHTTKNTASGELISNLRKSFCIIGSRLRTWGLTAKTTTRRTTSTRSWRSGKTGKQKTERTLPMPQVCQTFSANVIKLFTAVTYVSVSHWQAFSAYSIVCGQGQESTLEWII